MIMERILKMFVIDVALLTAQLTVLKERLSLNSELCHVFNSIILALDLQTKCVN